ncbi:MAG: AMP-binding protein, partial [Ilumatobacter sp.]
ASTAARRTAYSHAPRRFLVTSSIGFDSSLVGLIWPLVSGGAVVMPTDDVVGDVDRPAEVISSTHTSHILTVPSLYRALLARRPARLVALDTVVVAGEATSASLVDEHHRVLPGTTLIDEYGPTEATIWSASGEHIAGREPNIGQPIPGVRLRVVGDDLRPSVIGTVGELLVAGPTLADGYLGDPAATAERFVELEGTRWYRTGDRVRVVEERGERVLRFVGRVDDQLNVGGNRLEPAEVEHALTSVDGVLEAAVVAAGEPVRVIAHVVARGFDEAAVRGALAAELPARSVPQRFVVHDDLPRTAHGKVDRRALERFRAGPSAASIGIDKESDHARTNDAADLVVSVWRDALDRHDIGPDTDFFDVGGDSLTAVVIVTQLGDRLGREVPIGDLIVGLTPRGMAERLELGELVDAASPGLDASTRGVQLLTMRSAPEGSPLVILTPGWDDVFGYQALANAFPDGIEVLALAIDPTIDEPDARTVDGFARRGHALVAAALDRRPAVAVAGWSIGGLGAVELAKRVNAAAPTGARPPLLALIDTIYPGEDLHLWANRWSKYRSMIRPGGGAAILREALVTFRRRFGVPLRSVGLRLVRLSGVEAEVRTGDGTRRSVGVPDGLISGYVVEPIVSPVLLVSADTTNPKRTRRRWEPQASNFVEVLVEGRHRGFDSIMHEGRVDAVAEAIAQRLDGAG